MPAAMAASRTICVIHAERDGERGTKRKHGEDEHRERSNNTKDYIAPHCAGHTKGGFYLCWSFSRSSEHRPFLYTLSHGCVFCVVVISPLHARTCIIKYMSSCHSDAVENKRRERAERKWNKRTGWTTRRSNGPLCYSYCA